MSIQFRKRVKLFPGINLNFSKSGISTSIGPRGAKVNFGKRGAYVTTGIPGTGIYSRQKISGNTSSSMPILKNWAWAFMLLFGVLAILFLLAGNWDWALGSFLLGYALFSLFSYLNKRKLSKVVEPINNVNIDDVVIIHEDKNKVLDPQFFTDENINDPAVAGILSLMVSKDTASVSFIQRTLKIGYNAASRMMNDFVAKGYVGEFDGKERKILIDKKYIL